MSNSKILIGVIAGPHGVRGAVKVRCFTENVHDIGTFGGVYLDAELEKRDVHILFVKQDSAVVQLGGVVSRDDAEILKGKQLFVKRESLPSIEDNSYYYEDLIGCVAYDEQGQNIGVVKMVQNFGAGDVLVLQNTAEEVMWPFNEEFILKVDLVGRTIIVASMTVV